MIRPIIVLTVVFAAATADARAKHKPRPKAAAAKTATVAAPKVSHAPSSVEVEQEEAKVEPAPKPAPRVAPTHTPRVAAEVKAAETSTAPISTAAREQIFEVAAELSATGRYFAIRQDLYGQFLAQEAPLLLLAGGRVAYYPLAHTSLVSRFRFAITGRFAYGLPAGTRADTGERVAITTWDASGALRGDLRFGIAQLSVSAGAGAQSLALGALATTRLTPDATYIYLRPAIEARFNIHTHVVVSASAGYRAVLTAGALSEALPRSTIHAIDGDLRLIIPIAAGFEASAFATYARYFASINPQPGDRYVAGGFTDDWPGGGVSFAFTH